MAFDFNVKISKIIPSEKKVDSPAIPTDNTSGVSHIFLAPMEGILDEILRDILTCIGGYDFVITPFIRVSQTVLPNRAFYRGALELGQKSLTKAGTPVIVQLLGSDPEIMAKNAERLARLAPYGIDLNFGCPAPTVNRHGGGATLLGTPELIHDIVRAVRKVTPPHIPVSAKMRLGLDDTTPALACAAAIAAGGANTLIIHARTRQEGYRPPAHWDWIARIRESISIPVIANGDIFTLKDYLACRISTGCKDIMLGRGALRDPFLASRIKAHLAGANVTDDHESTWRKLTPFLLLFWTRIQSKLLERHASGCIKMWLNSLRLHYPEAEALYQSIRALSRAHDINNALKTHGVFIPSP